jgi:AcrR family transcriptional regulator
MSVEMSRDGDGGAEAPPTSSSTDSPLLDQAGRVLGPRALGTRQRLLDATRDLLGELGLRELRVIDIARKVEISPATFYQYFKDVEDAVLCLARQASEEMPALAESLEGSWQGEAGLDRARTIVDAFITHWDHHSAVLRVRNLASDQGDARFVAVRGHAMGPVMRGLAKRVEESRRAGRVSMKEDANAAAAAMGAILERLAAYHAELENMGVTRELLVETSARILHRTVTGETVAD